MGGKGLRLHEFSDLLSVISKVHCTLLDNRVELSVFQVMVEVCMEVMVEVCMEVTVACMEGEWEVSIERIKKHVKNTVLLTDIPL